MSLKAEGNSIRVLASIAMECAHHAREASASNPALGAAKTNNA